MIPADVGIKRLGKVLGLIVQDVEQLDEFSR